MCKHMTLALQAHRSSLRCLHLPCSLYLPWRPRRHAHVDPTEAARREHLVMPCRVLDPQHGSRQNQTHLTKLRRVHLTFLWYRETNREDMHTLSQHATNEHLLMPCRARPTTRRSPKTNTPDQAKTCPHNMFLVSCRALSTAKWEPSAHVYKSQPRLAHWSFS